MNNYEKWKMSFYNISTPPITYLSFIIPGFNKKISFTSNDVAKMYKKIFDWLKSKLDPTIVKKYKLAIIPNPNEVIIGKFEETSNNVKKLSKSFDVATAQVGISVGVDGGSIYPILKPTSGFSIKKASLYGVVHYNNKWLGIRIEKN